MTRRPAGGSSFFAETEDPLGKHAPEQTLIFTWTPHEADPDAGEETMVSVFFRALGAAETEVEVRHTLFPDESMRQRHEDGWTATLDRLDHCL